MTRPLARSLGRVIQLPPPARGQFGPNHTVVEVLKPDAWIDQDPFILLMDDRLDGRLVAGPHPHAGFETVTFPLEGGMQSESGAGRLRPGDVEWTTAGSGIVHGPEHPIEGRFRILQLWLTLPKRDRWTAPDNQIVPGDAVPIRREAGVEIRLYSGSTGTLASPTRNRVPVTLLDVRLEPGARVEQNLPTTYNGFLYVLSGEARVGEPPATLRPTQVGWLDRPMGAGETERGDPATGDSVLTIANDGPEPMRLLLYAGERQGVPLVSYGPFIGDTRDDIVRSFERYKTGTFQRY
jgi:redox-sensitive bicupin YhaK (pirin superfamily)